MPRNSGLVRQAAPKRSSSARRSAEKLLRSCAQQRGHNERVVAGRHQGVFACKQLGEGAAFVDREVVDHRLHRERQGVSAARAWSPHMISCKPLLRLGFLSGAKMKPMPPPDMPPSIQKPQKSSPNSVAHACDQRFGEEVATPTE